MFSSFVLKKKKANNIYVSEVWNVEKHGSLCCKDFLNRKKRRVSFHV